ncbi:MAG: hypothetical protein JW819_03540 [Candidatus Krumholzibacteriota bacterium]|nr:hypothetical protein [Candidatus Krumholzibacteriota bacterium]
MTPATRSRLTPLLLPLVLLAAAPALAETDVILDDDPFWKDEEFADEFMGSAGSGGGPSMTWFTQDLDGLNGVLRDEGLKPVPEKELYWGGAGWAGVYTGDDLYVAIGGGGFGGSQEARSGDLRSRWTLGAGYFAVKAIYPVLRRVYAEGGVQLGGGHSSIWIEDVLQGGDPDAGLVLVHLRADRDFVLLRPHLGVDLRLSNWVGLLFEGGYTFTSGDWEMEGRKALIRRIEGKMPDGDGPYASVMVRFGI